MNTIFSFEIKLMKYPVKTLINSIELLTKLRIRINATNTELHIKQ